ncbi:ER membrane protein complex subunit 1, partial [Podospora aff. communis PSN243]
RERKDVLVMSEEEGSAETVVRRLSGVDGAVVWEFREKGEDVPMQVSTNAERVFAVGLRGQAGGYGLRVVVLDTLTGKRSEEVVVGRGEVKEREDVMFVGANSAAPIVAWTDLEKGKLFVNVLGAKNRQEFALAPGTVSVEVHAPHLVQSEPHFLVHSRTATGNRADVYHVNLKTNVIEKAYDLPELAGPGAFSTSSDGANVYFTRITDDEMILLSSASHGVLGRWPLSSTTTKASAVHGVSEVVKKSTDTFAVRAAAVTTTDDWILIRDGETAWSRPEGMSGAVAATFAEIPESEELVKSLEQEAHSNPLEAYIHRVKRHIDDLQYLPAYLNAIPSRLISGILGTEVSTQDGKLHRDSFGFHKLAILATRRGMVYGLDVGNQGKILWSRRAFQVPKGDSWQITGIHAHELADKVMIFGSNGDAVFLEADTGKVIDTVAAGPEKSVQSTVFVDTVSGPRLVPVGVDGKIGAVPSEDAPRQTIVTRGSDGALKGVVFAANGSTSYETTSWIFSLPRDLRVVNIATRAAHEPVASIGRVLGDRTVKYKYLNPNTLVLAAADDKAHALSVYLLDTVSGQVLSASQYDGVDTGKSVECAMAENWFVCSFFGQYTLRDNTAQSLKGYQIVVSDLYESDQLNNRGPLGESTQYSTLDPMENPEGPSLPSVVSQTFVLNAPISAIKVTQTRQGISSRHVLAYLPELHGIASIPRMVLEPRRPVGRDPTPAEAEEGLMRYSPNIEIDPKTIITHERDVVGITKIITSPAIVESTSLVFAFGIDVFGTRGFDKVTLIGTPVVLKKQINSLWKAPM